MMDRLEANESEADNPPDLAEFFDVKFYPYNPQGAPPVFAATSKRHVGKPLYDCITRVHLHIST